MALARKKCGRCKKDKIITEFSRNRSRVDGLQAWCRDCYDEYREAKAQKEAEEAAPENVVYIQADVTPDAIYYNDIIYTPQETD